MSNDKLRRLREAVQFVLDMDEMRGNDFDAKYPEVGDPTDLVGVCAARLRKALAEPEPEPTPTDPERAIIGWVADNCGLTVAQEAELARRLESLRTPTIADLVDERDEARVYARQVIAGVLNVQKILGASGSCEIDKAVQAVVDERDEARTYLRLAQSDLDALAKRLVETEALLLADRAEVERLRAGGCARDQTTTQFCAEAVALQRENERLRAELAAKGGI